MTEPTRAQLLARYVDAASRNGAATLTSDEAQANEAHDELAEIYRELRRRGPDDQAALLDLLDHEDGGVRLWAAAHALEFAPERGEPVLRQIRAQMRNLLGFVAGMTLARWREGALEFP
mgnify:CR=1 FL=1